MFEGLFTDVADLDQDIYRNICGVRQGQDLFDDLSDEPEDQHFAMAAEMQDKPASAAPLITRPFEYGTVISFPFEPENWQVSRFSEGVDFSVWYGALEFLTTVHETLHHWLRFQRDAFADYPHEIIAERRVYLVRCRGLLVDLRAKCREFPALLDPADYDFSHRVGAYLHQQNQNGLLSCSARCEGSVAAVLQAGILANPRDHCYLTYRWRPGDADVKVERTPGRVWRRVAAE